MTRICVVLLNLGGPDKPESIRPFLTNFFMDKNIIRAPWPVRFLLSRYIAFKRSRNEAGSAYAKLGGKSPLLDNTQAQAAALLDVLKTRAEGTVWDVQVCMRYWHPMADEVAARVRAFAPDEIILLPMYPQYSTTTTRSSVQDWVRAMGQTRVTTRLVCCYPTQNGFIRAAADRVKAAYDAALRQFGTAPRVLFSAHGLPVSVVKSGDPYQRQCEQTAQAIVDAMGIEGLDWQSCYQSRVGPMEWIGPSTEDALHRAAADKMPVVIFPHAFTQDHVETLVEIEDEYREKAHELGVPGFIRVDTVGTHPDFIGGLADLVLSPPTCTCGAALKE